MTTCVFWCPAGGCSFRLPVFSARFVVAGRKCGSNGSARGRRLAGVARVKRPSIFSGPPLLSRSRRSSSLDHCAADGLVALETRRVPATIGISLRKVADPRMTVFPCDAPRVQTTRGEVRRQFGNTAVGQKSGLTEWSGGGGGSGGEGESLFRGTLSFVGLPARAAAAARLARRLSTVGRRGWAGLGAVVRERSRAARDAPRKFLPLAASLSSEQRLVLSFFSRLALPAPNLPGAVPYP